jgi:hypothetical protein
MTDAMGHEVGAAVLATVLVGALRNARRAGAGLAEQARLANAGLCDFAQRGGFVTGQVARIDLRTETATIVNAGHPPPLRLRDSTVERVDLEADPPFGIVQGREFRVQHLPLAPSDRLMFLTDGLLECNVAGVDIEALLAAGAQMHPREAVQHLLQAVLPRRGSRTSAPPARSGRARGRRSPTASRTGPAPRSIPFASRVRCLVALGACRRRTALGPGLLAAGRASNSTLLSNVSARASFVVISQLLLANKAASSAISHRTKRM